MRRRFLRTVARGLIGVFLLAQMAIAAYACPQIASASAVDMQMTTSIASQGDPSGESVATTTARTLKYDDMSGTMDPSSANLCAEHCRYGQQSDQAPTVTAPAALLTVLYAAPLVPEMAPPPRPAAATMSALVAASPPHAILHCVYRI